MENNSSLTDIIVDTYRTFFDLIKNIASLVMTEARMAKWSIFKTAMLMLAVALSASFSWLSICVMICIYLTTTGLSLMAAVSCIVLLNLFILASSTIWLVIHSKTKLFPASSRQLETHAVTVIRSEEVVNE